MLIAALGLLVLLPFSVEAYEVLILQSSGTSLR